MEMNEQSETCFEQGWDACDDEWRKKIEERIAELKKERNRLQRDVSKIQVLWALSDKIKELERLLE